MPNIVYLEDRFLDSLAEARVSLFDRGYLLGDSVFETLRLYEGRVFALEEHLDRLFRALEVTGINVPAERSSIGALVREAATRSGLSSAYVRLTVSRGQGGVGLGTVGCDKPVLSIIVKEYGGYPADAYERGIESITLATRKVPAACLDPALKTGNYLPNIMAKRELERSGMIEGVVLSMAGDVVSGSVSNIFLVKEGRVRTPSEDCGIRPGVTREILLRVAASLKVDVTAEPITVDDLHAADEIFFANTLMECLPVRRMDGHDLASAAPTSWTRRLHAAYRDRVLTSL